MKKGLVKSKSSKPANKFIIMSNNLVRLNFFKKFCIALPSPIPNILKTLSNINFFLLLKVNQVVVSKVLTTLLKPSNVPRYKELKKPPPDSILSLKPETNPVIP